LGDARVQDPRFEFTEKRAAQTPSPERKVAFCGGDGESVAGHAAGRCGNAS